MRHPFALLAFAFLATACIREPLLPGSPRSTHEPNTTHRAPADSLADTPPGEHVYLTAVRYPDGFDWELDTCAVDGKVWIDLFRDGERIRSVQARASVHADMHRFIGGHLYADASTESETVVWRDGIELFRFPGRESFRGFLVREDGVHTLGQDRDGSGFTYRVDGRVVFRSETGTVLGSLDGSGPGALTEDGEAVLYACRLPSERGFEYRAMRDAEVLRTVPADESVRAFGIVDGRVCRVSSTGRKLSLEVDGTSTLLALRGGEALLWCRLLAWKDGILALCCVTGAEGRRFFLQSTDGRTFQPAAGETVSDCLAEGDRMGWLVTGSDGSFLRFRWSDGGTMPPSAPATLVSGRCALLRDGHLLLALTGRGGTPNRFQLDSESTDIPFNGYFTSVTVE